MILRAIQSAARSAAARIAAGLLLLAALGYVGAIGYLVTQETRLVFEAGRPLSQTRPGFPYEHVELPRADGAKQFGWVMRQPGARTWVLFLHGNSATIASRVNIQRYAELRALGLHVFAAEYRGFGGLPGVPSEASVDADARAAYAYLTDTLRAPASRIVLYGWSLGSAVAVDLAAATSPGAVILEGAPASLVALGEQRYPLLPIRLVMRNPFESIEKITQVRAPLLFLHSPEDVIVPIGEGRRLYDAAPGPKRFVEVKGGHIRPNEVDGARFFGAIRSFLEEHGLR